MGLRKIDPEEVRKMAKQGMNDNKIAEALGVAHSTIKKCRDSNSILAGTKVVRKNMKAEVGLMMANGLSTAEMMKKTGLSECTIVRYRQMFKPPAKALRAKPSKKPVRRMIDP